MMPTEVIMAMAVEALPPAPTCAAAIRQAARREQGLDAHEPAQSRGCARTYDQ